MKKKITKGRWIKERKMKSFVKKPVKGGTPAIEKNTANKTLL